MTALRDFIEEADRLAYDENLSRKTLQAVELKKHEKDSETGELIEYFVLTITEEINRFDGEREISQRFYRSVRLGENSYSVQDQVNILKSEATLRSLGRAVEFEEGDEEVSKKANPAKAAKKEVVKEDPVEEESTEEVEEVAEKPAKTAKPAKTTTTKAKKKVIFDSSKQPHMVILSGVIKETLGKDWKTEEENKDAVKDLITNILPNRVAIFENSKSVKPLPSFIKAVQKHLENALDLKGEDSDLGDL